MKVSFFSFNAAFSTFSVPLILVRMEREGSSMISFTPTAAAR